MAGEGLLMKSIIWELPILLLSVEECVLPRRLYRDEYGVALLEAEHWMLVTKGHKKRVYVKSCKN